MLEFFLGVWLFSEAFCVGGWEGKRPQNPPGKSVENAAKPPLKSLMLFFR